jgi:DsbC/DsbD-like thiol-disulfide interchange protein
MMSCLRFFALFLTMGAASAAENGRARVDWISESPTCEAGKSLRTAIRMVIDPGWHTYWINPGDAGMKTSIEWKLPSGWVGGALEYPVPERYSSGEMAALGYKGTVLFPVTFTAPPEFSGTARLGATVSWLACNDGACIPGEAEISIEIQAGPASLSSDAGIISDARGKTPLDRNSDFKLEVAEQAKSLVLKIHPLHSAVPELVQTLAFPASPDVIPPIAEIRFVRVPDADSWEATVPKSEYATESIRELQLVLVAPGSGAPAKATHQPISLAWRKSH